jgi:hypothetical protein
MYCNDSGHFSKNIRKGVKRGFDNVKEIKTSHLLKIFYL